MPEEKEDKKKAPAKKPAAKKTATKTSTTKAAESKTTAKASAKSTTTKKASATKTSTTKVAASKTTAKKSTKKTTPKKPVKTKIDPKTGRVVVAAKKKAEKPVEPVKKEEIKKVTPKKTKYPKKSSKELTIEPVPREPEPLVRPKPKKVKELSKEDKVLYRELENDFAFVANMTNVVEDRTMDRTQITDLAIGELHVIETVNKYNNKPMTLIARKEHITVGALTTCVNRLVQKGYLLRTRDEMDRRIILLSVTAKGKKVVKLQEEFHNNIIGLVLENGVTLAQAHKVMQTFAKYIEGYYDPKTLEETPAKKKK